MINIDTKIKVIDDNISNNIESDKTRGLLSQNILSQLRNLVEAVAVKIYGNDKSIKDITISYQDTITPALNYIKAHGKYKFLSRFHNFLQHSISHYTVEPENAERLMLKYYEHLLRIRNFLIKQYSLEILSSLEKFPINLDKQLREYYTLVSNKIKNASLEKEDKSFNSRYYIRKIKPFFINNEIFYEVTFTDANDKQSKFDRIIAYTRHDILVNYSVKINVRKANITMNGFTITTLIIDGWEVSIRPCEFDNIAKIFNEFINVSSANKDYQRLMKYLTTNNETLNYLLELENDAYINEKKVIFSESNTKLIAFLDKIRAFIIQNNRGSNIIKYLLYTMRNDIIKKQSRYGKLVNQNGYLSLLRLHNKCIPFEEMPYASSLVNHNPSLGAIYECIPFENREHELLARIVKERTEKSGKLFVKKEDIPFENIGELMAIYNDKLHSTHSGRRLEIYKGHVYINDYDSDVKNIIEKLLLQTKSGISNYSNSVRQWLKENDSINDSPEKEKALISMFDKSRVSAIYGSAGVGKTTLINLVASFFATQKKLFLANTHPAIDNLKRRVKTSNCEFMTISKFLYSDDKEFDIIFIDECSTVSNRDMRSILERSKYQLLVLVGDVYQIESITFGNWFELIKSFIPQDSVVELEDPYRTENKNLLNLWKKVREIDGTITETLIKHNYVSNLDNSIFQKTHNNEIILCLNYDGLYGINNINKILQDHNPEKQVIWGVNTYKVNDPVLFNESSERFAPLLYNNLKGTIKKIETNDHSIIFEIALEKAINELELVNGVTLAGEDDNNNSIIKLSVMKSQIEDNGDSDDYDDIVPFNIAYAISIHKSQGLEFDSVKIVILNEIDELITHNVFYTAITRTKNYLKIYWSPETQTKIIENLKKIGSPENAYLISSKHGFVMNMK